LHLQFAVVFIVKLRLDLTGCADYCILGQFKAVLRGVHALTSVL
jgi:hypothetical protein